MKILFQGGWTEGRDPYETREPIREYCHSLARHVVASRHAIVLTSSRDYDKLIADEIVKRAKEVGKNVKDHLVYLLSENATPLPNEGRVIRFPDRYWWIEERTYCVQETDALIAVGGGRGTYDSVEKALLSNKPVFVAGAIPSKATRAWRNRVASYKYVENGDSTFLDDANITADEFFDHVFSILDKLGTVAFSRRVFLVHGRDPYSRDSLTHVLRSLKFDPVVLQEQPNLGLTIIEKLERDTEKAGYAFVLYTPDDAGGLKGEPAKSRARQNVVFEHGLLIGLLGRDRTCAILVGDTEMPSDVHGMVFERISDFKGEALKIAKILKDAGYEVDASGLL